MHDAVPAIVALIGAGAAAVTIALNFWLVIYVYAEIDRRDPNSWWLIISTRYRRLALTIAALYVTTAALFITDIVLQKVGMDWLAIADWKPLLAVAVAFIILIAGVRLNDRYFAWLLRKDPLTSRAKRPPVIILAICFVGIIAMMLIYPPSEIIRARR